MTQTNDEQGNSKTIFTKVALMAMGVGGKQTVPNAEAWALSKALMLGTQRDITILPDASYVVKGMCGEEHVRQRMLASGNGHTWKEAYSNADKRTGYYSIKRTPAHVTAEDLVEGSYDTMDFIGNALADALAGVGASNEIGRTLEPQNMERIIAIAEGITKRIAIIEARRWEQGRKQHCVPTDLPEHEIMVMDRRTRVLERRVELMGHKLIKDGNWYKCTECRRKCKQDNYDNWVNNRCALNSGTQEENHGRLTHVRGDIGMDSDKTCSLRKRKRIVGKQKEILAERQAQEVRATKEARSRANCAISWTLWGKMACGKNYPPITAHWSHALISCGGFGGCIRCGSVAGYCKNSRLENKCRGRCPTGSRGPIRRLAMGKYPHPQGGQGKIWVDGTLNPQPTKWKVDQRVWKDKFEDECEGTDTESASAFQSGGNDNEDVNVPSEQVVLHAIGRQGFGSYDCSGHVAGGEPLREGTQPNGSEAEVVHAVHVQCHVQNRVAKRARFVF